MFLVHEIFAPVLCLGSSVWEAVVGSLVSLASGVCACLCACMCVRRPGKESVYFKE